MLISYLLKHYSPNWQFSSLYEIYSYYHKYKSKIKNQIITLLKKKEFFGNCFRKIQLIMIII